MAANTNNGAGMSGIDLFANIVPVRVLGECGGTDVDVFEGMLWASGVQIAGVPPNPYPAKVINMSLGGFGTCPNAVQDAIDDAMAQGAVVVVAAGNESSDTSDFAPSGCNGVITVGASTMSGDITFYSNFGRRVDISAPGGDFDAAVLSLSNDGQTVPGNEAYATEIGTSASAPHVSGVVSMMLARDPTLTAGRVLSILQGTAREFPLNSICRNGNVCGAGLLDAGLAMASTVPGGAVPPPGAITVVEYYRSDLDHYRYSGDPAEIAAIDNNPNQANKRTGFFFFAWPDASVGAAGRATDVRVPRQPDLLINSYYFTSVPSECQYVIDHAAGTWALLTPRRVLGAADRRRRPLHGRDDPGLPLLEQPEGLQPADDVRSVREARDDQPRVGAGRRRPERHRFLRADLTRRVASHTDGGAFRRPCSRVAAKAALTAASPSLPAAAAEIPGVPTAHSFSSA